MNLKLKLQETWFSKSHFEYGKIRYYKGVFVSHGTKQICRLIPDITDGISSLLSSLSTINTITEGVAKMSIIPDVSFIINQWAILNYLDRRSVFNLNINKHDLCIYLLVPSDVGGLTLSTYFNHSCRGCDDKVTLWISEL